MDVFCIFEMNGLLGNLQSATFMVDDDTSGGVWSQYHSIVSRCQSDYIFGRSKVFTVDIDGNHRGLLLLFMQMTIDYIGGVFHFYVVEEPPTFFKL